MSSQEYRTSASQQALEEAIRWSERLRDGDLPEGEALAWLSWYEKSEENSRAFDELQDFWNLSGGMSAGRQGQPYIEQLQRYSWWNRCMWRAEDSLCARLDGTNEHLRLWRTAIAWSAALAVTITAIVILRAAHVPTAMIAQEPALVTSSGTFVRAVTLPDDSKVELAPRTTIAVAYSSAERRLEMSAGEATFVVAPNKKRPFTVNVDTLRVRAVGTQFDIHRTENRIVVTVIEGKIDVYRDGDRNDIVRVTAGQQFTALGSEDHGSLSRVDLQQATMWREGRLRYVNEPLSAVIADVNRYVKRPIVIKDEKLGSLTYTGTVFTQLIDQWLGAIPNEFPLAVITESDRIVLVSRAADYQ